VLIHRAVSRYRGIFKDAVFSIMATIARQENIRRSERIRAGVARTKAQDEGGGSARTFVVGIIAILQQVAPV
jgi:DNA invertase Pin-like site-specific DNA recombinase